MTSAPAIGFEYRPSRLLAGLLGGVALLAALAVLFCGLAWWLKCLLLGVIAVSVGSAWRSPAGPQPSAVGWSADGGWSLRLNDGSDVPVQLRSSRVYGGSVLLRLAQQGRRPHALWLLPDNSDADIRRRLRMRLALASRKPLARR
jgi:toxin CptA